MRGLHYDLSGGCGRVVRCISGNIFSVIVDMREQSETFSLYREQFIGASKPTFLYIP